MPRIELISNTKLTGEGVKMHYLIRIDGNTFGNEDFNYIQLMSEILQNSSEIGRFELGNLTIEVVQLNTYENNLIKL